MDALFAYAVCRKCKWSSFVVDSITHSSQYVCEWDEPEVDIRELSECPKENKRLSKSSAKKHE